MFRHNVKWKGTKKENDAFCALKDRLSTAPVLTHFRSDLPLRLDIDASNYGIGAVISPIMPNGEERPIAFASRTLSKCECNYAQIEKEALSIIFGVKKFHVYLYGRKFVLVTDHKPLLSLLGSKSGFLHLWLLECRGGHCFCPRINRISNIDQQQLSPLMLIACQDYLLKETII